ncbi:MAG: SUMF1/EgtB/PvdO family nonheme iron enzyme [Pseudohongiellaceae bacterium]|nr:SUMF1/EgtB/PvdO family nonheme iron enzyme [Pseudohongiellaceae bacterium]
MTDTPKHNSNGIEPESHDAEFETITPFEFTPPQARKEKFALGFRAVHGFILAFILVAAAAAWFVLSAKSVSVQVEPPLAEIDLDAFSIALGGRQLVLPGEYGIAISHPGFEPMEQVLTVGDDAAQNFSYQLKELPGYLELRAYGEAGEIIGAKVHMGSRLLGTTPIEQFSLESGRYDLSIAADRYLPYVESVDIQGRELVNSLNIQLAPAWANIGVRSEPSGADVIVNGQLLGITPLNAQLLQGQNDIEIKLAGHKLWRNSIAVTAGQDRDLPVSQLEPADGLVLVRSNPSEANVTVNGQFKGTTPLELELAPDLSHEIELFKSGYERAVRTLEIASAGEQDVEVSLTPITSTVRVIAEPADAQLYIDGELIGAAMQSVDLLAASQIIEIRKEGYIPYTSSFTSRPGLEQELRVTLKSLEQARLESIQPVITTVTGQTLKLFYPDQFTMGASRREAGRRANEDLRQVKLERPFYLATTEVTNAQFKQFMPEHSSGTMQSRSLDLAKQPVVQVSWQDAALYCNWLSAQEGLPAFYVVEEGNITGFNPDATGYRLPTEAEWEWAARTDGNGNTLRYPWGANLPPPDGSGNFADTSVSAFMGQYIPSLSDGFAGTAPVATFNINARGLYDMAGNVSEWVHDYYGTQLRFGNEVEIDPMGPDTGSYHTVKGSSWAHSTITELRLSFRDFSDSARNDLGFRVARYLEDTP